MSLDDQSTVVGIWISCSNTIKMCLAGWTYVSLIPTLFFRRTEKQKWHTTRDGQSNSQQKRYIPVDRVFK